MEEALRKKWEGLTLIEQESDTMRIEETVLEPLVEKGNRCLLLQLIAERTVNKQAFKTTMSKVWRPEGWIQFKEVGDNRLLAEFQHERDKTKVLQGRPWSFDRNLVCLQELKGHISLQELDFNTEWFWVQAHEMPVASMTREIGRELFSGMVKVVEVETDESGCGWGSSLRARVIVDITKPLIRGRFIKVGGVQNWVPFKYERLPLFCFECGAIIHTKHCQGPNINAKGEQAHQYGPWLRANPPRLGGNDPQRYGGKLNQASNHEQKADSQKWAPSKVAQGGRKSSEEGKGREAMTVETSVLKIVPYRPPEERDHLAQKDPTAGVHQREQKVGSDLPILDEQLSPKREGYTVPEERQKSVELKRERFADEEPLSQDSPLDHPMAVIQGSSKRQLHHGSWT
ncbi:uncharacterized protein LOC122282169 [Carya illinoinensis]|uniref:uncharacterized protein LOC122282169 n=1 Tax=Carya illinoinensis TaxID=32201 RepID=UPI001C71CF1D|nr:uncharacterized protein LOC122282169 [Carya illinoinensis]